jgi:hypothetical protein
VHELEHLVCRRIAATSEALAGASWPAGTVVLPIAPGELLAFFRTSLVAPPTPDLSDPAAISILDTSWSAHSFDRGSAETVMRRLASWELSDDFAQGMVAGIAAETFVINDETGHEVVLFVVPGTVAADFADRLADVLA